MKDLTDKVVVITGASSGIGRATAMEFARGDAKVVLAGRDAAALREAEQEAEGVGGSAMAVVCDVTHEDQVERLAARAEEAYGHIDIWVNNAGVAMFAKFEDSPSEDFKRVIDTNFFGYVYGARAALKRFKAQGNGTLINVDSVEGAAPKPYHSAYAASKHAVRALSSSLRMELALDGAKNIHVCTVMPASVDTPLFAHAANYTGRGIQGPEQSSSPSRIAETIVKLSKSPQREAAVGAAAKGSILKYLLTPASYERETARSFPRRHLTEEETADGRGNLYDSTGPHTVHGGWKRDQPRQIRSSLTWVALAGAAIGIGGLAAWLFWPTKRRPATPLSE